ncbi:DUF222 domain-containing protein, partial [Streptomyces sp. B6B3]|uniref:HNH endonuclease signature motif containing protein n=1 Tax=Streptomyces sp. B6B3 TaxID=3153570 RepID=UPI00325CC452
MSVITQTDTAQTHSPPSVPGSVGEASVGEASVDELAAYLAAVPVGADTAGMLPLLRAEELGAAGRIDALRALERHGEWIQALQVRVLAALEADPVPFAPGHRDAEADLATTVDEVACALRLSAVTASARLDEARRLVEVFDRTLGLLEDGRIHYQQARAVCEITANCSDDAARRVESLVAPLLPQQSTAATRKALHRAVIKADPDGAQQRHERAREDRRVACTAAEDGMAWWRAFLTASDAARVHAAVDTHAQTIATEDDPRSLDQRRADALVDLVANRPVPSEGTSPAGRTAPLVQITVPYDTLIGVSDDPGELKGYGPVTAGQARALATAPGSVWRRLLLEPKTGLLVKTDPTTYHPTAEVERHVIARDATCQFPSCSMPAHRCDIDHIQPFNHQDPDAGGPTEPDNLMALCRRHHRVKHQT